MEEISGKNVVVTGGANGLGFNYTQELLRNEAKCAAILDLPTSNGNKSVDKLEQEFGKRRALFIECDVTKEENFKNAFKKAVEALGHIDILINNAGILFDTQWQLSIDINYKGVVQGSLMAIEHMGKKNNGKGGLIVNISSITGLRSFPFISVYCGTKHAVLGFSQSIAGLYEDTGVRVVIMCPGVTDTPLVQNVDDKIFDFVSKEACIKGMGDLKGQKTEHVAKAMMGLIKHGKNGAAWVCEGGEPPYEVDFPDYTERKLPIPETLQF